MVVSSRECRNQAEIGLISGREDHGGALSVELGYAPLQKRVVVIGSVGNAGAGSASARLMHRSHARFHACRIESQAEIVVGPKEQTGPSLQQRLRGRKDSLEPHVER